MNQSMIVAPTLKSARAALEDAERILAACGPADEHTAIAYLTTTGECLALAIGHVADALDRLAELVVD